ARLARPRLPRSGSPARTPRDRAQDDCGRCARAGTRHSRRWRRATGARSRAPASTGSSRQDDPVERLRVGEALRLAQLRRALADALLDAREIAELTRVTGQRLDLEIHHIGDVVDELGIFPLNKMDLDRLVGLALMQPLRDSLNTAGQRVVH